jgi:transposase InsO family protein
LVKSCHNHRINQKFTKTAYPQANGKTERVIRALIEMRHNQQILSDSKHRQQNLKRLINNNDTVKPHKAISGKTPYEFLEDYFNHTV